jgi:hypothetical protein
MRKNSSQWIKTVDGFVKLREPYHMYQTYNNRKFFLLEK